MGNHQSVMGACVSAPRTEDLWEKAMWERDVQAYMQGTLRSATGLSYPCQALRHPLDHSQRHDQRH